MSADTPPTTPKYLPLTHSPSEYAETLPPRYRALYLRATSGHRPSARKAVCLECLGWSEGAIKSIRLCPCAACPNHAVRPYQDEAEKAQRVQGKEDANPEPVTSRAADPSRIERLKKAREARKRQSGEGAFDVVFLAGIIVAILAILLPVSKEKSEGRCPPVSSPTGRLLCYSGGILVYQTNTYRNGGVLCSSSGVEIKTIPGGSQAFCIEESRQGDVWDPPEPSREAER